MPLFQLAELPGLRLDYGPTSGVAHKQRRSFSQLANKLLNILHVDTFKSPSLSVLKTCRPRSVARTAADQAPHAFELRCTPAETLTQEKAQIETVTLAIRSGATTLEPVQEEDAEADDIEIDALLICLTKSKSFLKF